MANIAFEKVSGWEKDTRIPQRATSGSAGYDMVCAKDTVVPPLHETNYLLEQISSKQKLTYDEMKKLVKDVGVKATLVPTGLKAKMPKDMVLDLNIRSSTPLNTYMILANGTGIIDSDYYNNPDNEGHIYFQIINLSPFSIIIKKGDVIGQGIFRKYYTTDADISGGDRKGGFGSTK